MLTINKYKLKEIMAQKEIKNFSELAKLLGISKNQLSNLLSDKYNPIKSNMRTLADFLNVSPLELISESELNKEKNVK